MWYSACVISVCLFGFFSLYYLLMKRISLHHLQRNIIFFSLCLVVFSWPWVSCLYSSHSFIPSFHPVCLSKYLYQWMLFITILNVFSSIILIQITFHFYSLLYFYPCHSSHLSRLCRCFHLFPSFINIFSLIFSSYVFSPFYSPFTSFCLLPLFLPSPLSLPQKLPCIPLIPPSLFLSNLSQSLPGTPFFSHVNKR